MSLEGYFDEVIDVWNKVPHTKCIVEDMKGVIRQFNQSRVYGDFEDHQKELELADKFTEIYKEVYK